MPQNILERLRDLGCQVRLQEDTWHPNGMFWRYLPLGESDVERIIFRDADSRIGERDAESVRDWILSDRMAHIIRDHPFHQTPLLGGLWGIKNLQPDRFWDLASKYSDSFGQDQIFLANHVYFSIRGRSLVHDKYFAFEPKHLKHSLTTKSDSYMGESFSEKNLFNPELREKIKSAELSRGFRIKLLLTSFFQAKFLFCKSYFVTNRAFTIPK